MSQSTNRRKLLSRTSKLLCFLPALGFSGKCTVVYANRYDQKDSEPDVFQSWMKIVPYRFVPIQLLEKIDCSTRGLSEPDWVLIGRIVPRAIEKLQSRIEDYSQKKLDPSSVEYYDFIRCLIAIGKVALETPEVLLNPELLIQNRTLETTAAYHIAVSSLMTPELVNCALRDIMNDSLEIELRLLAMNPMQCEGFSEMVEQGLRSRAGLMDVTKLAIESLRSLKGLPNELMSRKKAFLDKLLEDIQ